MRPVLVDTSVWVQHFRHPNAELTHLLQADQVLSHPLVIGELACGTPPRRQQTLADLGSLQAAQTASLQETLDFIERDRLYGLGCGWIDLQLLASTRLTPNAELWTLDRRLAELALRFGVMHPAATH